METVYERQAAKALRRIQPKKAQAIMNAIARIATDPLATHRNVERLAGTKGGYRLRHGDLRAVYRIDRDTATLQVLLIEPRGKVYRR
jgi:mRNA interferase RelE/StbE